MVLDVCKKSEFKHFVNIAKDVFELRWGKENIVEEITKIDKETGKLVYTGKFTDTDLCNYELHRFFGSIPDVYTLTRTFNNGQRIPSMSEMKYIGDALGMDAKQMVPCMKEQLKRAIIKHDKSRGANGVENFTINGINLWLDKDTRTGLLLRFQAEKAQGKTNTVLWHEGMQFPLVIEQGIQMLYAIEVYASQTYDLKESLLAEVDKLESVDEMITFDKTRTSGYPANLAF